MDPITGALDTMSIYNNQALNKSQAEAEKITNAANNITSDYTREDLEKAAKSFESYMVEQVMKQVKKNMGVNLTGSMNSEDNIMSQYSDMYMDSTIKTLAEDIVNKYGGNFTESMVQQMARNYGISLDEDESDRS